MGKTGSTKRTTATSSAAAFAAALLGTAASGAGAASVQQTVNQAETSASTGRDMKHPGNATRLNFAKIATDYTYKFKGEYAIAGQSGANVVFKDSRGSLFYIDPATGDQKFLSRNRPIKDAVRAAARGKHFDRVKIVGMDDKGRLIMSNLRGERFHLDAATGDFKFEDALVTGKTR